MVKRLQVLFYAMLLIASIASAKDIAITFDDLPANREISVQELLNITDKILTGLDKHNIHAIGFVNEEKLHLNNADKRSNILNQWISHGNILGNHTYAHVSLHTTSLNEYENQILSGESVTKKLMENAGLTVHYFRHPYLHTGLTKGSRNSLQSFLKSHDYQIAPVTYDTDDWQFDRLYVNAINNGDFDHAQKISEQYLEHTRKKFDFYEKATKTIFGREISQIWLLHANSINADNIESLIMIAKNYGFSFISLQKALQDKAYATIDNYYLDYGVSWLYRWDYSTGLRVDWQNEPKADVSDNSTAIYNLEKDYARKIGVYAIDTNTGRTLSHRANELFPIQSTFKVLVAALLLKKSEADPNLLDKKIEVTKDDTVAWHPITGKYLPKGKMSLKDLAAAAISYSDNVATNLIMKVLGGPQAITKFAHSIGNKSFDVNHFEVNLNSDPEVADDVSTPMDMANTLKDLLVGDTLSKHSREMLLNWMQSNTTGKEKIRGGVPQNWNVADKTGAGNYGIVNDIGLAWPSACKPIILSIYTVNNNEHAIRINKPIAQTTKLVIENFMKHSGCISSSAYSVKETL